MSTKSTKYFGVALRGVDIVGVAKPRGTEDSARDLVTKLPRVEDTDTIVVVQASSAAEARKLASQDAVSKTGVSEPTEAELKEVAAESKTKTKAPAAKWFGGSKAEDGTVHVDETPRDSKADALDFAEATRSEFGDVEGSLWAHKAQTWQDAKAAEEAKAKRPAPVRVWGTTPVAAKTFFVTRTGMIHASAECTFVARSPETCVQTKDASVLAKAIAGEVEGLEVDGRKVKNYCLYCAVEKPEVAKAS